MHPFKSQSFVLIVEGITSEKTVNRRGEKKLPSKVLKRTIKGC
jgi:hypothetical protein